MSERIRVMKSLVWLPLVLACGVLSAQRGEAAEENPIAFGPYIQNVTDDGAVVCWSTYKSSVTITTPSGQKTKNIYENHEMPLTKHQCPNTFSINQVKSSNTGTRISTL